jgi:hypothetical protein
MDEHESVCTVQNITFTSQLNRNNGQTSKYEENPVENTTEAKQTFRCGLTL